MEPRFALAENTSDVRSSGEPRGPGDFGIRFPFTPLLPTLPTILLDNEGGFRADHQQNDFIGQRNHHLGATVIWPLGSHLVRAGGETQVDRVSFETNRDLRLTFRFTGRDSLNGPITSASVVPLAPNNFGVQNFAYAFADFLMGRAVTAATSGYGRASLATRSVYGFLQDEWRVHPRATVSLGLRYELTGPAGERGGSFGGSFILGHQSSQYPTAPLGLAWDGDAGTVSGIQVYSLPVSTRIGYSLHYWRTDDGSEVDFVLYGERGLKAFDVKRAARLRREDLQGLQAFIADYPAATARLLYGGTRHYWEGAIEVVPLTDAFQGLPGWL